MIQVGRDLRRSLVQRPAQSRPLLRSDQVAEDRFLKTSKDWERLHNLSRQPAPPPDWPHDEKFSLYPVWDSLVSAHAFVCHLTTVQQFAEPQWSPHRFCQVAVRSPKAVPSPDSGEGTSPALSASPCRASAWPSWWPFTELVPVYQCLSWIGGPESGPSILDVV